LVVLFSMTAADARKAPRPHRPSATHAVAHHLSRLVPVPLARPQSDAATTVDTDADVTLSAPTLSIIAEDKTVVADAPSIVKPSRRIFCVEFARLASGIALFGDARTWWDQAGQNYAQISIPTPGAVMVFAARKKMRSGHVAVVKKVLSNREVLVDHANWGRDGRIYLNAPVIDVSPNNDWSEVKVWNTKANIMGTTAYALKGFITQRFAIN